MLGINHFKLRERILLGYGVPLLLTVAATSVVVLNAQKVNYQSQAVEKGWSIVQDADRMELYLYKRQAMIRGYLLTGSDDFLQAYQDSVDAYNELVKTLESNIQYSTPEQKERLEALKQIGQEIKALNKPLIDLVKAGKTETAVQQFKQGAIINRLKEAEELFKELNSTEDKLQSQREVEGQKALQALVLSAIVGTLAAIVMAVSAGIWLASRITEQITAIASNIATSSAEIAVSVEQQERTAIQQSSSVNQTTTTMDELSASSRQSAEQAEASASGAQQVLLLIDNRTQEGHINQSSLREKVSNIATQILHLSEQTNQIGTISTLVSDLANQTNMLALNAAVEAVRAGENGKGFAVVAAEIRKLADQSKKSAEKINELVVDIQQSTNSTVMVTDEGTKTVERIVEAMKTITLNSQQISLTSNQQAVAVQQVVEAMNSLNTASRESTSGISQIKVGTQRLNDAAHDLKAIV